MILRCSPTAFDLVFSFTAFHLDLELVMAYFFEIKRVLQSGRIVIIEFKQWRKRRDVELLISKIERCGGTHEYEAKLDSWRHVPKDMLTSLCECCGLEVLNAE